MLVFRTKPRLSFLLMRHPTRYDLPKGHVEEGESERESALRELQEETGISPDEIELDPAFRFETSYVIPATGKSSSPIQKCVVIFLGRLRGDVEIRTTEHIGSAWIDWQPPHQIQPETIDPLLAQLASYWEATGHRPQA